MKNKKLNYFLIAAVALLWGFIIFQIIGATAARQPAVINREPDLPKVNADNYKAIQDTTHLSLNYRDPFTVISKDTVGEIPINQLVVKNKVVAAVNVVTPAAVNWKSLEYGGYIYNTTSKKLLALIKVDGKECAIYEGETVGKLKLLRNMKDSIKVLYSGQTKFILMTGK
jgi:hypothetical protein